MSDDAPKWLDLVRSANDISRDGVPPIEYDIDGLLESTGGPAIIFAPPEAFKTWISLFVAASILNGTPFLGRYAVRKRPHVIYVNLDAGRAAMERRIALMGLDDDRFLIVSPEQWDVHEFEDLLSRYPGAFVILDCATDAFAPEPGEDIAFATRRFIRGLRKIFERYGANGFLIDHSRRPAPGSRSVDYYGSVQRKAAARMMWSVHRVEENSELSNVVEIACEKMSEAERFAPFRIAFSFGSDVGVAIAPADAAPIVRGSGALEKALIEWSRVQMVPFSKNFAEKGVAGRANQKRRAIAALIDSGVWAVCGKSRGHDQYEFVTSSSSRTRSDEADEASSGSLNGTSSLNALALGDDVLGRSHGTRSALCSGCQRLDIVNDANLCVECVEAARSQPSESGAPRQIEGGVDLIAERAQ